ncbi:MAG: heavy metal-binding domain-containing protein [Fuerstiella sp.]|nr:heavy metal-binding domain-containing protein [Fuerstiella sp.]
MIGAIVNLLLFLAPFVVFGLIIGRTVEKQHFRRLDAYDAAHEGFLITQIKSFPMAKHVEPAPSLVVAEVVIASDYLKSWFAKWRNLFGGEVRSFQTLQTRAKREAVARLRQTAIDQGFNAMCNVRVESADVGGSTMVSRIGTAPMAAVIATATAYHTSSAV